MDGRRVRIGLIAAVVCGAAGCKWTRSQQQPAPIAATQPGGGLSQGFANRSESKKFPTAPPEQVATKPARKKGQGVKLETEIAWAETQVEAALAEGRTAVEKDQLLDDARQRYQKALHADPKNKTALVGLARLYEKSGDRARSAQMYQEAIKVAPKDHETAFQLAKMLARGQDWTGATEACTIALRNDPENRSYQKTLGYCQARSNQWDAAFSTMLKIMPEADARYFLGRVLMDLDREPDARQQFEMALQIDRSHSASVEILAELDTPAGAIPHGVPESNPVQRTGFEGQGQWQPSPIREGHR
jgi:tetratricopeptide (TPR) repeat protein